jgi:enamine deaminase RidA (YjgF/YER057c/UK114 family)
MPSDDWKLEPFNPPDMPVPPGSGYAQAVRVNDFVFVAGNMASAIAGSGLEPTIRNPPGSQWGRPKQIRAQADWIIKKKLEPALKAAGASLSGVVKATVHLHDTANFPDFLDVWAENFHDIPCALTVAPAKGFAYDEGIIEINLIALKDGATRRKQVLQADIPPMATFGPCVRAGEFVFPSGLMPIGRDGRVVGGDQAAAFDGLVLPAQLQAATVMSYAEAACKAAGTTMANTVRAQYFTNDMKNFAGVTAAWQDRYGKHPHPFGAIQVPGPMPAPGMSLIADFWIYAG